MSRSRAQSSVERNRLKIESQRFINRKRHSQEIGGSGGFTWNNFGDNFKNQPKRLMKNGMRRPSRNARTDNYPDSGKRTNRHSLPRETPAARRIIPAAEARFSIAHSSHSKLAQRFKVQWTKMWISRRYRFNKHCQTHTSDRLPTDCQPLGMPNRIHGHHRMYSP